MRKKKDVTSQPGADRIEGQHARVGGMGAFIRVARQSRVVGTVPCSTTEWRATLGGTALVTLFQAFFWRLRPGRSCCCGRASVVSLFRRMAAASRHGQATPVVGAPMSWVGGPRAGRFDTPTGIDAMSRSTIASVNRAWKRMRSQSSLFWLGAWPITDVSAVGLAIT